MSRRTIVKPSQKNRGVSGRRCQAAQTTPSSSSSEALKATPAPEPDDPTQSQSTSSKMRVSRRRSHSKTKPFKKGSSKQRRSPKSGSPQQRSTSRSKSPVHLSPPRRRSPLQLSPGGSKSPKKDSPTKRPRSRTQSPVMRPDSPRSPIRTRSTRRKNTRAKSPFEKKSPLKEAAAVKSPPKTKTPKPPKRKESLLLSEGRPGSFSGSVGKSTPFGKNLERLREYATARVKETQDPSTSHGSDRKSYVFLPTSEGFDRDLLSRVMSQLYGYLGTVEEEASAQYSKRPSVPSQEADESSEGSMEIVVIDCRNQPPEEDPVSEKLITGVSNMCYESPPTRPRSPVSSSSSSSTLRPPKGAFRYNPDMVTRRHSADAAIGRRSSSRSKARPPLQRHRNIDLTSSSSWSIEMHELLDRPLKPKRRHSKDKDSDAREKAESSSKPARKKSFDGASRAAADGAALGPPPKPTRPAPDPPKAGTSGYRDVRHSIESEDDQTETKTASGIASTSDTSDGLLPSRRDFQEYDAYTFDFPSDWSDRTWNATRSTDISTPLPPTCYWGMCYRAFLNAFTSRSANVQQFCHYLSGRFVQAFGQPGQSTTRRFFMIAGLSMWVLVRDATHDFWFFCAGGPHRPDANTPPSFLAPAHSLDYALGGPEPEEPPTVPHLTKTAKKAARKARKKMKYQATTSKKPETTPEQRAETIQELLHLIHEGAPSGRISPRRDYTPSDCPFITLSFQDDTPENPPAGEAHGEASVEGENKPSKSYLNVPDHEETEGLPPRKDKCPDKND